MSTYLRPSIPSARAFFTVNLEAPESSLLVDEVERLRWAVTQTHPERWFGVKAWVVLPDHMHCIWVMPEGNTEYSTRSHLIKSRFSRWLPKGQNAAEP